MSDLRLFLEALTPEAESSIGGPRISLSQLPFRVGRESRLVVGEHGLEVAERRKTDVTPSNDLYLHDRGPRLQVSRNHLEIDADPQGGYRVIDRGSACGTIVGSTSFGGRDKGGEQPVLPGEVIIVGTSESPFVFRFLTEET